jgi:hypothetical protein
VLAFTRDELLREPPDVLFLSAEMLERLSVGWRHLNGDLGERR